MTDRIIQNGEENDKEGILALRRIVFKEEEEDKQNEVFWEWQFKGNPDGKALIYVLKDGDKVVGHFADIPKRFVIQGKEILGTLSLDMMVHPEYRGGMFIRLGRYAAAKTKERGFAFLTSCLIRPWSIKGLRQIGWKGLFELPVLIYPLRFPGIVNRYLRFLPLSLIIGGLARTFYFLFFGASKENDRGEIEINEMTRLDDTFDQFWQKALSIHVAMGIRDRNFMTWRYLRHPVRTYTIYRAMMKGEMKGYIVLRKVNLLKFNSAVIVDLFTLEKDVLGLLVEKGIEYSKRQGADLMGCIVPKHHLYYKILRQKGFFPSLKTFLFMIYPHAEGIPLTPEGWYVNWGDTDVI